MSGNECTDFGATAVGSTLLCRVPEGNPFPGLITYRDGRVAAVNPNPPANTPANDYTVSYLGPDGSGNVTLDLRPANFDSLPDAEKTAILERIRTSVRLVRDMQGSEIGTCGSRMSANFSLLPTFFNGAPVTWNNAHLTEFQRILGNAGTNSGNAFMCSDSANSGTLAFNSDSAHRARVESAYNTLNGSCGSLDANHCAVMLESLRVATGRPAPQSTWEQIKGIAGYLIGGVFVFITGGLGSHIASKWWDGRGGPKGPTGGSPTGTPDAPPTPVAPPVTDAAPRITTVDVTPPSPPWYERAGNWVSNNGRAIGWGAAGVGLAVATAVLVLDDATGIGVADDPLLAVTGPGTVGAFARAAQLFAW